MVVHWAQVRARPAGRRAGGVAGATEVFIGLSVSLVCLCGGENPLPGDRTGRGSSSLLSGARGDLAEDAVGAQPIVVLGTGYEPLAGLRVAKGASCSGVGEAVEGLEVNPERRGFVVRRDGQLRLSGGVDQAPARGGGGRTRLG